MRVDGDEAPCISTFVFARDGSVILPRETLMPVGRSALEPGGGVPSLRQLEYLVALAETRHFRRAAERTSTTQPTLSEQLKALEDRLGVQLVERSRAGAVLTSAGARIVEIARRMITDAREIRAIAASEDGTPRGILRLAVPPTVGGPLLQMVMPELLRAFPELKLHAREELPQTMQRLLEEGLCDVAITPLAPRGEDFVQTELFSEPLFIAVAASHPLARKGRIEQADLYEQEMVTLGPGHHLHDIVAALCQESGARLRHDLVGTSLDMVREMVGTGLGMTLLPGLYVRRAPRAGTAIKTIPFAGRSLRRSIGLVWRRTSTRSDAFEAIARLVRSVAKRELGDLVQPA